MPVRLDDAHCWSNGCAGKGASRVPRSSVRFEVEQSPATTPSWKSNAWNRAPGHPASAKQEPASPILHRASAADEAEWEQAGEQASLLSCQSFGRRSACELYIAPIADTLTIQFMQADREWYDQEEGGIVDETHNPFVGGDEQALAKREAELQKKLVFC